MAHPKVLAWYGQGISTPDDFDYDFDENDISAFDEYHY